MEPIKTAVTIIQLLTPFTILLLGWWYTRQQRRSAEVKETERKLAESERTKLTDSLTAATDALTSTKDEVDQLAATVRSIATITQLNGRCTSELAQLLMVVAEGLRDQHLDGNITKAVEKYRDFESKEISKIMSGVPGADKA